MDPPHQAIFDGPLSVAQPPAKEEIPFADSDSLDAPPDGGSTAWMIALAVIFYNFIPWVSLMST
ncbi:hypothetical protein BDZ94DRAFT_143756 [Collybia nuda]|uniref:Uncharacterized protein n=1 Tax=Collybia nuda TaxID=64659 RepID=A0A9P5XYQ7_9AGAR|nr:hypothetical protein BDZ94DRAFT_143756 [Collybia nuda]